MEKEQDYLMKLLYIPLGTFISLLMVSGIIGSINHLSKTSGLKDEYDRDLPLHKLLRYDKNSYPYKCENDKSIVTEYLKGSRYNVFITGIERIIDGILMGLTLLGLYQKEPDPNVSFFFRKSHNIVGDYISDLFIESWCWSREYIYNAISLISILFPSDKLIKADMDIFDFIPTFMLMRKYKKTENDNILKIPKGSYFFMIISLLIPTAIVVIINMLDLSDTFGLSKKYLDIISYSISGLCIFIALLYYSYKIKDKNGNTNRLLYLSHIDECLKEIRNKNRYYFAYVIYCIFTIPYGAMLFVFYLIYRIYYLFKNAMGGATMNKEQLNKNKQNADHITNNLIFIMKQYIKLITINIYYFIINLFTILPFILPIVGAVGGVFGFYAQGFKPIFMKVSSIATFFILLLPALGAGFVQYCHHMFLIITSAWSSRKAKDGMFKIAEKLITVLMYPLLPSIIAASIALAMDPKKNIMYLASVGIQLAFIGIFLRIVRDTNISLR